jgi:hypothetical protein
MIAWPRIQFLNEWNTNNTFVVFSIRLQLSISGKKIGDFWGNSSMPDGMGNLTRLENRYNDNCIRIQTGGTDGQA